jgi:hypothetical protein
VGVSDANGSAIMRGNARGRSDVGQMSRQLNGWIAERLGDTDKMSKGRCIRPKHSLTKRRARGIAGACVLWSVVWLGARQYFGIIQKRWIGLGVRLLNAEGNEKLCQSDQTAEEWSVSCSVRLAPENTFNVHPRRRQCGQRRVSCSPRKRWASAPRRKQYL